MKYFCNTCFCFVLCIHLVPSCNSLLMFVANFFSIFNHHTDVFVYFIYLLTYSVNKNLDFITHLFIYYLWIYTVSKHSDFVIYLSTYLFLYSFTWIVLYLFTHTLYIVLLVSSIFSCFHWMKCRFVQTHPLGGQHMVRGELKYVYRFLNLQESEVRKRARSPERSI